MDASSAKRIKLEFRPVQGDSSIRRDLSAAAICGRTLFVACDESASVERLLLQRDRFADHRCFPLSDFFDLPGGADGEMDIEGLSIDGGYLWITGSHSLKRDKPELERIDHDEAVKKLTDIDCERNRYFFGRIPLVEEAPGVYSLTKKQRQGDKVRRAAAMKSRRKGNALTRLLRDDVHFGPFMNAPGKENGFDIEGLAVRGRRAFVGLRGPVLRGLAIVLEFKIGAKRKRTLKAKRFSKERLRYAKHFLDLDGLGVRDLLFEGDDLLVLAGPTMDLDGPAAVYRWRNPLDAPDHSITPRRELERVMDLPYGQGADHPESIVVWRNHERAELLVVYDSPARERLADKSAIAADVFALN